MWRVEEVVQAAKRPSQPGWDYVIDTGFDPSKAPITPANRKRTAKSGGGDTTAKQNAAILKRLAELDKDNARDIQIPVPSRQKDSAGRSKGKTTATRKILLAQKTFTNYLADEEALLALEPPNAIAARSKPVPPPLRTSNQRQSAGAREDVQAPDAEKSKGSTQLPRPPPLRPASNGLDDFHLLQSIVPQAPSDDLMEALVSAPSLSYNAARVEPSNSGRPPLHFCEMCGYWGNYKCRICGNRYCGLTCKTKHDVDCQKYGAR
ncbi:MAG: hypothetical protein LQ340_005554 [Diploschistes diacapsis]|nr:MAG: hypothetical protein LQ340_005554 [Diploschistes diacapsis]